MIFYFGPGIFHSLAPVYIVENDYRPVRHFFQQFIQINSNVPVSIIEVCNMQGQPVLHYEVTNGQTAHSISAGTLANGMYLLSLSGNNGKHYYRKIIKE